MIDLSHELDGAAWKLEPFQPGCVEEYEVEETGRTKAVVKKQFYNIGDRPFFKPFISYDCESFLIYATLSKVGLPFHSIQSDPYPYFLYFWAIACKVYSFDTQVSVSDIFYKLLSSQW